ncbi:MAG: glycosyltransferase family 2 protein [Marinilabilia sp.]
MSNTTTAVVILNWNTCALLERFLPGVIRNSQLPGIDIVVADNGSTDGSVSMLKKNFPEVRIIELDRNYGFAGGYNRALRKIDATYTVLLNSDVAPAPNWLPPLIECMDKQSGIAACVPKIKAVSRPEMFEYAGAAGGFMDKWGYIFCRGRIFDKMEKDQGQYDTACPIFWGSGAALLVRTTLFNKSGGLDEDFFAHMEEIDWCWRMKNQGYEIWFNPESTIFHLGGGTLNAISPHKNYLNFRNNLFMMHRNLPGRNFGPILLGRILLDILAAVRFLFSGHWQHFGGVIKAHCSYFKSLQRLKEERKALRKDVKKESHPEIYPRSIVFDFFFKNRKKFSDLKF